MKILLPFDGSEASQNAIRYALNIGKSHSSSDITLLTVACSVEPFARDEMANPTEAINACRNFFRENMEKAKAIFDQEGVKVNTIMATGNPAEVIINTAKDGGFEKIIMGRRGLSTLTGWVLGSVSAKVIANVDVPVTLVK